MSHWFLDPERSLSPAEAARLLAHARATGQAALVVGRFRNARDGALVTLLLATGIRVSEALGVRIGDVTLRRDGGEVRVILLKKRRNKDGSRPAGLVFLARADVEDLRPWVTWLRERGADDDAPFLPLGPPGSPRATRPLSRQAASQAVRRLLAAVGIERAGVAAHALRHAVGVLTQAATGNTRIVQARLHHSSVRTSETYSKVPIPDFRDAIETVAAGLRGDP